MILLNLIAYNILPILGVVFLGWQVNYIVTIYFWETAFIGFFVAVKLNKYRGPEITEMKDPNKKAMAIVTSPLGFAFYFFFALSILSLLFFGALLRESAASVKEISSILIYLFMKNTYEYLRYFIGDASYKVVNKEDLITANLKDIGILMLGVLLGGLVLLISKNAAATAIIVMMSTVILFSFLGGIFGFNKKIFDQGLYKK